MEPPPSSDAPLNKARRELAALRALVGPACPPTPALDLVVQRPRVGVGCVLCLNGALLVGARRGSHGAGRYAMPGGHMEYSSTPSETASAELREECGVDLPPSRWRHVHTGNTFMPESDLHYITLYLRAELSAEEAAAIRNVEEDKCEGWEWVECSALRAGARPLFTTLQHFLDAGGEAK